MTDPIADMLTRIRNAQAVHKPEIVLPFSKMKFSLAEILKQEGYVKETEKLDGPDQPANGSLKIVLKYLGPKEPAIGKLTRISKPGRRIYRDKDHLPVVLNHLGIAVISTPRGLMTNKAARKAGLGGEVICEIY